MSGRLAHRPSGRCQESHLRPSERAPRRPRGMVAEMRASPSQTLFFFFLTEEPSFIEVLSGNLLIERTPCERLLYAMCFSGPSAISRH